MSNSGRNHPQNIGPWKLGKTLGRGATGRVLLATHQSTGQKAAVKVVSKSELQDDDHHNNNTEGLPYGIEREIIIMKLLNHPNVLRLYDVWETSKALYLVLEYVEGGELFDLLVERGPLPEIEAIKYFRAAYCHALGICHRDLKPENLLLDASLNVKLADFGMAALESNGKLLETSCGSPHYAAPEIVSGLKYHGAASDVWSCGVILFALLTGRLPFDDENIRNLLLKVQAGSFEMPTDEISKEAQNLLAKMLEVDPTRRITTEKILKHPLLTKYPCSNEDLISERALPHPQTAYKSLGSVKNIDKQILGNLSILWNDRPQEEIIQSLLRNGSNPEKTFYALLMRYKHNQEEGAHAGAPSQGHKKSASFSAKVPRSNSKYSINGTPRKKRASQVSVSRPTSFAYRNSGTVPTVNNRNSVARRSTTSSVNNSPYKSPYKSPRKSPHKRYSYSQSPSKSPYRRGSQKRRPLENEPLKAIPRNIYNEIVDAQSNYSLPPSIPPSLPSKDSRYLTDQGHMAQPQQQQQQHQQPPIAELPENPIVDEAPDLMQSANISSSKRNSMISKAGKRSSKRRSLRMSMTTGLKRNSITMKLLSTYAKLSGDDDWEYMDKQTKRTSATFALLCDKIFNQEDYNEEDEQLIDPEEKEAKEYERLMEIERKKHEAEMKARKELEKKKKRQKRRSILSSRKLSIIVKNDADPNNSEQELVTEQITQPKRQSKNLAALRALSEGGGNKPVSEELTMEELENLKKRSASQPEPRRRSTPILTRRPVSRLDPLWQAHENEELERAKDALEQEWRDSQKRNSVASRKKANRESMISVMDDILEENHDGARRRSRDTYREKDKDFELPEPNVDDSNLTDDYMSEIRKSRLLNSQLNIKGALVDKNEPQTLISNVKIPNVTRKSRNFTNSNKRLSVLSMYSTKESYRDLNSIINHNNNNHDDVDEDINKPALRTSIADRLDKAGYDDDEEEGIESVSVIDLDDRRLSYYSTTDKRASRASTTKRYTTKTKSSNGQRPSSKVPELPKTDYDDTFVSNSDEVHQKRQYKSMVSDDSSESDDVFDRIKLPEGKSTKSSIDALANGTSTNGHRNSKTKQNGGSPTTTYSKPMTKVRGGSNNADTIPPTPPSHHDPKKPLDDKTNYPSPDIDTKRKGSFFRKLSWGSKKTIENNTTANPSSTTTTTTATNNNNSIRTNKQLPSPAEEKPKSSFFRWFSSSSSATPSDIKKYNTILPKQEMSTALFALLQSWSNFGLKDLHNDSVGYYITGAVSKHNSFNLKSCKFRIKINPRDLNQKSEIVCVRVKGSKTTTDTLFTEIEKVLLKEGVLDK
ncbi:GIN4 Serine/threonine-protein kinase GIN4 [Candida maltosa Xu316]